ncbi:MAG: hypothetical protein AAB267_05840, partial [Candidatus Desantisbacteria bacterium]
RSKTIPQLDVVSVTKILAIEEIGSIEYYVYAKDSKGGNITLTGRPFIEWRWDNNLAKMERTVTDEGEVREISYYELYLIKPVPQAEWTAIQLGMQSIRATEIAGFKIKDIKSKTNALDQNDKEYIITFENGVIASYNPDPQKGSLQINLERNKGVIYQISQVEGYRQIIGKIKYENGRFTIEGSSEFVLKTSDNDEAIIVKAPGEMSMGPNGDIDWKVLEGKQITGILFNTVTKVAKDILLQVQNGMLTIPGAVTRKEIKTVEDANAHISHPKLRQKVIALIKEAIFLDIDIKIIVEKNIKYVGIDTEYERISWENGRTIAESMPVSIAKDDKNKDIHRDVYKVYGENGIATIYNNEGTFKLRQITYNIKNFTGQIPANVAKELKDRKIVINIDTGDDSKDVERYEIISESVLLVYGVN